MSRSPVGGFFLRVLLWLPLAFFAWYYTAALLTLPVTLVVDAVLTAAFPELVRAVEHAGHSVDVVTALTLAEAGIVHPQAERGLLVFSVNPLIYEYSIPLLFALVLASPGSEGRKLAVMGIGLLVLLPVTAFGVAMDILKSLAFGYGPQVSAALGAGPMLRNLLALAYQLGYLILPAVVPLVIWMVSYRDFVSELAPAFARAVRS